MEIIKFDNPDSRAQSIHNGLVGMIPVRKANVYYCSSDVKPVGKSEKRDLTIQRLALIIFINILTFGVISLIAIIKNNSLIKKTNFEKFTKLQWDEFFLRSPIMEEEDSMYSSLFPTLKMYYNYLNLMQRLQVEIKDINTELVDTLEVEVEVISKNRNQKLGECLKYSQRLQKLEGEIEDINNSEEMKTIKDHRS